MTLNMTNMTEAATTQIRYEGLEKGTMYRARVAGINVRGTGDFSTKSSTQTAVDREYIKVMWGTFLFTTLCFSSFLKSLTYKKKII